MVANFITDKTFLISRFSWWVGSLLISWHTEFRSWYDFLQCLIGSFFKSNSLTKEFFKLRLIQKLYVPINYARIYTKTFTYLLVLLGKYYNKSKKRYEQIFLTHFSMSDFRKTLIRIFVMNIKTINLCQFKIFLSSVKFLITPFLKFLKVFKYRNHKAPDYPESLARWALESNPLLDLRDKSRSGCERFRKQLT